MTAAVPRPPLSDRYADALTFAFELHRAQTRKQTDIPYVSHLCAVSALVLEYGGTEDQAIAGLLHDAVEDQGGTTTAARIRERFGEEVTAIVLGCTDGDPDEPRDGTSWRSRKERYLSHLGESPDTVRLVSAADKLHNARSIVAELRVQGAALWPRFNGGKDGTLWYYLSLVDRLRTGSAPPLLHLVEELARTVAEMVALA